MRGDRRSVERESIGRQNAADASARTVHRTLPARGKRTIGCARARQLLGAYRRDDWTAAELSALGYHLTTCASCRQAEARYRGVGEVVRQLPCITPPPAFRESVFAAIRAIQLEEHATAPALAALAAADTSPSLPVVRALPIADLAAQRAKRRARVGVRAALAIAAVLLLSIIGTQALPMGGMPAFSRLATSLGGAPTSHPRATSSVLSYTPSADASGITGAGSSASWVVFAAASGSGGTALLAENRQTKALTRLAASTATQPLRLRAVTDNWAVWSTGDTTGSGPWSVEAARLPGAAGAANAALMLASSQDSGQNTPEFIANVWSYGDAVLVAGQTHDGYGVLLRYDLASVSSAAQLIARTQAAGHVLTSPSTDGTAYYWGDVWADSAQTLHSQVWRSDASGHATEQFADDHAYAPRVADGTLAWVDVPGTTATASDAPAIAGVLHALSGTLETRGLGDGVQRQLATHVAVDSVQVAGPLLLWREGSAMHAYDLRANAPSAIDGQVRTASLARGNATTVTWMRNTAAPVYVYDVH